MKSLLILIFPLFIFCLSSCGSNNDDNQAQEEEVTPDDTDIAASFDSELTSTERTSLTNSLAVLKTLTIDGTRVKGFTEIFGGGTSQDVVNYLESRVNYFISFNTDYETRVTETSGRSPALAYYALNPSLFMWYEALTSLPQSSEFQTNGSAVLIDSTRIGVIQVGDAFTPSDAITQAITIVHEARHSDCPGGAPASDLERWNAGLAPLEKSCGQLHGSCLGSGSCDVIPWAPYAVDFIYSVAISETCTSCTETQKQEALINANQVQGAAYNILQTVNGEYGPPDMSSSNEIRDDL